MVLSGSEPIIRLSLAEFMAEVARRNLDYAAQAFNEFCAASSAGENADHAALFVFAKPSAFAAERNLCESKEVVSREEIPEEIKDKNSGYTGSRCCNSHPLASVRSRNCSRCGQGFSGLM